MQPDNELIVPNFLPNVLPRSDHGDHKYYCCTMLTLFTPWRTGKDLKTDIESWDKSFVEYKFSKRQAEIMNFFNIQYECLDARDNYSTKRDKEEGGIFYQWATNDVLLELDDLHDFKLATSGADFYPSEKYDGMEDDTLLVPGRYGRNR
jgi:hypothetical protein